MDTTSFKSAVESQIRIVLESEKKTAPTREGSVLVDRMLSLILRGGKRARPALLQLTYAAYQGNDVVKLIDLGVALELHHQFLLIHDDIIDNDVVRYNGPNIVGYYQNDEPQADDGVPKAMGLLAGDMLFSLSQKVILSDSGLAAEQKVALLSLLNDTNLRVSYGEQLDSLNTVPGLPSFSEDRLLLTDTLKTAYYSTRLPMQCAALLLDLSEKERGHIDDFAFVFGVLFQLIDDYSDYFVNRSSFNNRPKFRDFREGKVTYPLYFALTHGSPRDVAFLKAHAGKKDLSDTMMHKVTKLLETCGAEAASRERIDDYFTQTNTALKALSIDTAARNQFERLLETYAV